jgi:hypothetical protein
MNKKIITPLFIFLFLAFFAALALPGYVGAQEISVPSVPDPQPDQSYIAPVPTINSPREACHAYRTDPRYFVNNVFLKDTDDECLIQIGDNNAGYGKVDFFFKGTEFCVTSSGDYFTRIGGGGTSCKTVKKQIKNINGGSATLKSVTVGVPYRHDFSQELISLLGSNGGSNPAIYSFYLGSGVGFPPMGLIFGPDGVLFGTPSGKGGTFQACVRDLNGNSACRTYTMNVEKAAAQSEGAQTEGQDVTPPATGSGQDIGSYYGNVEIIREGVSFPANHNIRVFPGDTIKTGPDGFLELTSGGRTVTVGPDTLGRMLGFDTANHSVTVPLDWDTDLNFKKELDNWEFWQTTFNDLKDFINETAPVYAIDCGLGNIIGCQWGMIEFIDKGTEWFEEKMAKDFGKSIVVIPTAVVVPLATEFTVQVADDGATTLTVLDGAAVAMDLASKKSVIVKANQKLTVPKTTAGLGTVELQQGLVSVDPASLDRWWDKKPVAASVDASRDNIIKTMLFGVAIILIVVLFRRKQIFSKQKK